MITGMKNEANEYLANKAVILEISALNSHFDNIVYEILEKE